MLWCIVPELSLCIGLILIILYGLFSLSMSSPSLGSSNNNGYKVYGNSATMVNLHLNDVYFFSRLWPVMLLLGYAIDFPFIFSGQSLVANSVTAAHADLGLYEQGTGVLMAAPLMDIYQMSAAAMAYPYNNGIDVLLIILTVVIMQSFRSFESVLLLLLAFVGQLFMLHSCDLVSFYICLEAQNFCFLVLCGLQPRVIKYATSSLSGCTSLANEAKFMQSGETRNTGVLISAGLSGAESASLNRRTHLSGEAGNLLVSNVKTGGTRPLAGVEASIKYLLLSAFSSGVLLFWFSALYLRTGITTLSWGPLTSTFFDTTSTDSFMDVMPQMLILLALMFKLGGAPLHLWMVDIYSGVKRQLLMYLSTAPKLSLFGFWVSTWHSVWTDFTVLLFVALSMIIGCFGAYSQPTLRSLFAYSTINEIGLMLMAIETAGFHSLFQHLTIYIITMLLLWNTSDKRLFAILAVSLAGLPPLAGFFGKAWIFNSVATGALAGPYLGVLLISLFCTLLSLVYYLRVFRLFNMGSHVFLNRVIGTELNSGTGHNMGIETRTYSSTALDLNIKLTSFCVVFLIFAPLFYVKPFVL